MRINWQIKKLGEVCEVINRGVSPKYTKLDGLCVLNQKCIRDHTINFDLARLHDYKNKKISDNKFIQVGDVLVNSTGTGTLGRVAQVKELAIEATVDSHVTIVRPTKNLFFNNFFGYALIFIENEIEKRGDGCGGQTELARNTLKNDFNISFPESISEQRRIVKKLDAIFANIEKAKENAEKNLHSIKDIFEAYLHSVFANRWKDWEKVDFEDSIEKVIYTNKIQRNKFLEEGNFPIISQEKDLVNGYWNKRDDLFQIKKPVIIFGDHTQILKYIDFDFVLGADGVKILQSKNILNPKFFFYYLNSMTLKKLGYARHYRLLKEKQVSFPKSLTQQKSIVKKLDALSTETQKLEGIYRQKLADLEELRKSVLKKAFSGGL